MSTHALLLSRFIYTSCRVGVGKWIFHLFSPRKRSQNRWVEHRRGSKTWIYRRKMILKFKEFFIVFRRIGKCDSPAKRIKSRISSIVVFNFVAFVSWCIHSIILCTLVVSEHHFIGTNNDQLFCHTFDVIFCWLLCRHDECSSSNCSNPKIAL